MAGNDLAYLAKRMAQLASTVKRNGPKAVTKVVSAIGPVLVYATPVDTSRARVNWQPAIGTVKSDVLFRYPDKPPTPEYGGQTAVASILATAKAYAGGSYVSIANNLSYVPELNRGSSSQAPYGFVELSVQVGLKSLSKFRMLRNDN